MTIAISRTECEALKEQNAELSQKVDWLMEQLSLLFNEAEVYAAQEKAEPVAVAAHVRNRKSGRVKNVVPDNIPVEVVEHRLSEEELFCPICGTEMVEIGKEVCQTLEIRPAQVYLREDWYYAYTGVNPLPARRISARSPEKIRYPAGEGSQ